MSEAQATVRSYDTKAQIVGVGYIFALGIVGRIDAALEKATEVNIGYVLVAWGFVIFPIILFGLVLYPSRKSAPTLPDDPPGDLQHVLYVDPGRHKGVDELIRAARQADAVRELAFELLKVSRLRELKRRRFVRALLTAGFAFLLLFGSQFVQVAT